MRAADRYQGRRERLSWLQRLRARGRAFGMWWRGRGRGPTLRDRWDAFWAAIGRGVRIVFRTLWRAVPFVLGATMMALLPTAIVYGYRYVKTSPHFRVQHVDVTGYANVKVEEVLEIAGLDDAPSLLDVDLPAIEQALELHPWIKDAKVDRELPSRVTIGITEREPAAQLALTSLYLVDKRGVPFKRVEAGEHYALPVLTGLSLEDMAPEAAPAQRAMSERLVREALMVLDHWRRGPLGRRIDADEVNMDPLFGHAIVLGQGSAVATGATIHLGFGNVQAKLAKLETVLADASRRGKQVLEVRLDNAADPNRVAVRFRKDEPVDPNLGPPENIRKSKTANDSTNAWLDPEGARGAVSGARKRGHRGQS